MGSPSEEGCRQEEDDEDTGREEEDENDADEGERVLMMRTRKAPGLDEEQELHEVGTDVPKRVRWRRPLKIGSRPQSQLNPQDLVCTACAGTGTILNEPCLHCTLGDMGEAPVQLTIV